MTVDPIDEDNPGMARAARVQYRIKDALKATDYKRKEKDLRFFEILREIRQARIDVSDPLAAKERKAQEKRAKQAESRKSRRAETVQEPMSPERELKVLKKSLRRYLSTLRTEFQKRMVFAFASICFVLIGVPLGIRAQRRESTIGMAISLVTALSYYLVVILTTSMAKNDVMHPHVLIWLPVLACFALAGRLIPKNL